MKISINLSLHGHIIKLYYFNNYYYIIIMALCCSTCIQGFSNAIFYDIFLML